MFHEPHIRYVPDLLRSKFHVTVHKYYWYIHLAYAVILYFTLGWFALVYLWLFPSFILWHAGSSINTLSHIWGKQHNNTGDTSTNHWLTGIFMWGEGWHNNHHYQPADCQFGKQWWQIDVTWWVIKLMGFKPR
jgi:stearoyl-CoA desaturase (delta-9 desaturase)